jgi:hypothetical protein
MLSAQCRNFETQSAITFHANEIRAAIKGSGNLISFDQGGLLVPFSGAQSPAAIGAAGIWIGGFAKDGNIRMASALYNSPGHADYLPGPLRPSENTQYTDNCVEWDVIWSVTRNEVLLHLLDFSEDGEIHHSQSSIFGWPGKGNRFFKTMNGFALPDTTNDYAPFADLNNNERYEPDKGEYPIPNATFPLSIPDQMTWNVFNDFKVHISSQGDPLLVEIQQTCYAFYCEGSSVLNRTLFADFQIISRDTHALDSVYFALWMDPELGGCGTDDFVGCSPEHHTAFVYNHDDLVDANEAYCWSFTQPQGPGVLSLSFLNKEMSSFMYYANGSIGSWPHVMTDPQSGAPLEFYRVMTGSWISGAPLTSGGTGYNTDTGQVTTSFAYPGNPNDSTSWSMLNVDAGYGDFRTVASTKIGRLEPGQIANVSMAFALHLDTTLSHFGNLELMYEELTYLKEQFASGFFDCVKSLVPCNADCVWPGDANNDGIANFFDVLELGLGFGRHGPPRNAPLSWAPHPGDTWNGTLSNDLNSKFADMNGDGTIDYLTDVEILRLHYGLTHGDFQAEFNCQVGGEIVVEGGFAEVNPGVFDTRTRIALSSENVDSLYGLAFVVQYDTSYFIRATNQTEFTPFDDNENIVFTEDRPGLIEYAVTRTNGVNEFILEDQQILEFLFMYNQKDIIPNQHDTTDVCIANIKGLLADGTEIPMGANKIQFIFLDENITGVADVNPQGISVYPNPSDGSVYFEVPLDLVGSQYEVNQISGQLFSSKSIINEVTQLDLPAGVYILSIRGQVQRFVKKIVVLE